MKKQKRKMKTNRKTLFGIFCIVMLGSVIFIISLSLNASVVSAEQTVVCLRSDGTCDIDVKKTDCEASYDYPSPEPNINNIPGCQPSCCVFKKDGNIADTEWTFYQRRCDYLADVYGYSATDVEKRDLNKVQCDALKEKEVSGYCRTVEKCEPATKQKCADNGGSFSINERCPNCVLNSKTACENGDVYQFDSCDIKGTLVKTCDMNVQTCKQLSSTTADCVNSTCQINISFTNLEYDTAYLKAGQVEYLSPTAPSGQKIQTKDGKGIITLSNLQTACVRYQGPGERHYIYTCFNGVVEKQGLDEKRGAICDFNIGTGIAYNKTNDYSRCTECSTFDEWKEKQSNEAKKILDLAAVISQLSGADAINPEWWDYRVFNPGLCDTKIRCETNYGDCKWVEDDHDCVPKFAPATNKVCGDCMSTKASSPWNRCVEQGCLSRGYCQSGENKVNLGAAATICAIETTAADMVTGIMTEIYGDLGAEIGAVKSQETSLSKRIGEHLTFWKGIVADFNGMIAGIKKYQLEKEAAAPKTDPAKAEEIMKSEVAKPDNNLALEQKRQQIQDMIKQGTLKQWPTATAEDRTLNQFMDDVIKWHGESSFVEMKVNGKLEIMTPSQWKTYGAENKMTTLSVGKITYWAAPKLKAGTIGTKTITQQPVTTGTTGNPITSDVNGRTMNQIMSQINTKATDITITINGKTYTRSLNEWKTAIIDSNTGNAVPEGKINYIIPTAKAISGEAIKGISDTQYNNYVRDIVPSDYDKIMARSVNTAQSYEDSMSAYWKAVGTPIDILTKKLKDLALPTLFNYLITQNIRQVLSKLDPQYYIKWGFCTGVTLFGIPKDACMNSGWAVPVVLCTIESGVQGESWTGSCAPVSSYQMPGVSPGYANCQLCNGDSNVQCTAERCYALSSAGQNGCSYDATTGICSPNEIMVKDCANEAGTAIKISEITRAVPAGTNVYEISGIEYNASDYNVEIKTNKYSECRYFSSKDALWDARIGIMDNTDLKHTFHAKLLDISEPGKQQFEYYARCQDGCNIVSYTPMIKLVLKKNAKPDAMGPLVISQYPAPNMMIEGSKVTNGKQDVTIKIKTDEKGTCRYMRYALAEGPEGMLGYIKSITAKAEQGIADKSTEEQITATIAPSSSISWDNANMTAMTSSDGILHSATLSGLNNNRTYAYIALCRDEKQNLGEKPSIIKFRISEVFDISIIAPPAASIPIIETQPTIKVTTDRATTCRYSVDNPDYSYSQMQEFESGDSLTHIAKVENALSAKASNYILTVRCIDQMGQNIASATKEFRIIPDTFAPKIIRIYKRAGTIADTLYIATDEPTTCQYDRKAFTYGKGTEMTNNVPASIEHEAGWGTETYYIICKDRAIPGNTNYPVIANPFEVE